jgi:hypothetical protein
MTDSDARTTPILRATEALIDLVEPRIRGSASRAIACARAIERRGGLADAEALLPVFLAVPARGEYLLGPLMFAGDASVARRLLDACCDERGLRPGMPAGLLHLFGYHGLTEALPILWRYARGDAEVCGSYNEVARTNGPAVRGLLHLPCDPIRDEIEEAVRSCVGRGYFPAFLPALAARTGNPDLLATLDVIRCAGPAEQDEGIVLGTALFGEAGRARFEELVWTGTDSEVFDGLCIQGISVADVFDAWRERVETGVDPIRGLYVLQALLWYRQSTWHTGFRFAPHPPDTFVELYERIFAPASDDDDRAPLPRLAGRHLGRGTDAQDFVVQFDLLEQAYRGRMEEELLLAEGPLHGYG